VNARIGAAFILGVIFGLGVGILLGMTVSMI
jgi:hypothetical protein